MNLNGEMREAALAFHIVCKNYHNYKSALWFSIVSDLFFWTLPENNTWCGWSLASSAHWWHYLKPLLLLFSSSWKMKSTVRSECDTSLLVAVIEESESVTSPQSFYLLVFVFTSSSGFILGDEPCISLSIPEATAGTYCSFLTSPIKNCQWVRSEDKITEALMHSNVLKFNDISRQQH